MREIYYAYNNEALVSCIFLKVLQKNNKIEMTRLFLLLPFFLDDKILNLILDNKNDNFDLLIKNNSNKLISFNKRFTTILPVAINSILILNESDKIKIENNIILNNALYITEQNLGKRWKKINEAIPYVIDIIENYSTIQLYKILKIQL